MTDHPTRLPTSYWTNQIRAELAAARDRCCTHGIALEACNDCRAETTTQTKPEGD